MESYLTQVNATGVRRVYEFDGGRQVEFVIPTNERAFIRVMKIHENGGSEERLTISF